MWMLWIVMTITLPSGQTGEVIYRASDRFETVDACHAKGRVLVSKSGIANRLVGQISLECRSAGDPRI